jgi:hypothetical protein
MTAAVRFVCLGLLTIAIGSSQARAEIVLNLAVAGDSSTIGQTLFQITPGSTLLLDLYATQQGQRTIPGIGDFGDNRLSAISDITGVGTFLAEVLTLDASATNPSTEIRPTLNATAGTGFTFDNGPTLGPATNMLVFGALGGTGDIMNIVPVNATNPLPPMQNTDMPGTIQENSVLLTTFEIRSTTSAMGTSTIQVQTFGDNFGFTLGNNAFGGGLTLQPISATVTAVPEPGMFAALGFAACSIAYRKRRKAKRVKETQPLA